MLTLSPSLFFLNIFLKKQFHLFIELPRWLSGKESACQRRRYKRLWVSGRSPGEGNGNLLQYSCLRRPMDRGAWRDPGSSGSSPCVHGATKSQT